MGIPFITMDAHNIVNDNVAQGCGYPNRDQIVEISLEGPVVSFETNVAAPLVSLEAQIVATQEGSGTPSPSNVRPISGFSEVTIHHNSNEVEIQLGQTVYGGRLNVTTGELTITHKSITVEAIISASLHSSGLYYWKISLPESSIDGSNVISSHFVGATGVAVGHCYIMANGLILVAVPTDQTLNTKSLADAWCAENKPQFVYPLAEEITVQLSPREVNTIIGMNNISANTGDVKLTYIRVNK
jgi:hypothetical protein